MLRLQFLRQLLRFKSPGRLGFSRPLSAWALCLGRDSLVSGISHGGTLTAEWWRMTWPSGWSKFRLVDPLAGLAAVLRLQLHLLQHRSKWRLPPRFHLQRQRGRFRAPHRWLKRPHPSLRPWLRWANCLPQTRARKVKRPPKACSADSQPMRWR